MNTLAVESETLRWAKRNFGNTPLFNKKKIGRIIHIASRLAENKGVSFARLFDRWYDVKASYNLLNQKIMIPDTIQCEHRSLAYESMENWKGDVLAIEDSSEFEWNRSEPIEGLGPIGSGRKSDQGFILHSTLAIGVSLKTKSEYSIKVLGLPYQQYYVRPAKRESPKKRRLKDEPLETDLWREVIKNKAIPSQRNVIRICDRAADIYEVLKETQDYGCSHIIRLKHDRVAIDTEKPIKSFMQELPSMGKTSIERRSGKGTTKRKIELDVNWQSVDLRPPYRPGINKLEALKCTVVHIWGFDHETEELIDWFLHTNLAVETLEDALKITQYYALRWTIEDYHKALKSGMNAEDLQFKTAHALFGAIAIMSIVALRLVDLRERMRINPEAPAEESGLDTLELKALGLYLKREIKTVKCVAMAIGRLGGHQNRTNDGMPGLLALWNGMSRFISIMEGVRLMTI